MIESEIALSGAVWAAAAVTMLAAGVAQGALGFGFPAISTPILMLMTDVKTAIVLNLLPNFTVNLISIIRGGNWAASLGRYWPVALWVLAGSFLGSSFLVLAPSEPIRILLALAIFAYLFQGWLAHLDWSWLARRRHLSAMVFGLAGGFFSGSVNQSLPPLLIYFNLLGLETTVMTQILNLCFLGGKAVQAATLGVAGEIRVSQALANVPLTVIGVAGLYLGIRVQRRVSPDTYKRVLRYVLFVLAIALLWQGSAWFIANAHAASSEAEQARKVWSQHAHGAMMTRILPPSVEPRELPDANSAGARLTARYCVQCHHLPNPQMHTAERWDSVVDRMVWRMRGNGNMGGVMKEMMAQVKAPSDDEVRTLKRYLEAHGQATIAPTHPALKTPAGEMFAIACSQCHALPDPQRHSAREWPDVVERMKRHMAWANTVTGPPELRTSPELKTDEIVKLLQRYARADPGVRKNVR
jgi:uncharacterized membrane protein YfcA